MKEDNNFIDELVWEINKLIIRVTDENTFDVGASCLYLELSFNFVFVPVDLVAVKKVRIVDLLEIQPQKNILLQIF